MKLLLWLFTAGLCASTLAAEEKREVAAEIAPDPGKQLASLARDGAVANYLVTVADDFVVEVYHNGQRVPDSARELILERFGATGEKINIAVKSGDWLVFHVVSNRLRWDGSKYFAVAGCFET